MIVIQEKPFMALVDGMIEFLKHGTTDGNGLKLSVEIDREAFGAAIAKRYGELAFDEIPWINPEGSPMPCEPRSRDKGSVDLTGFMGARR